MAMTLGTGSLAVLTLGVAATLLVSERPGNDPTAPRQDLLAPEVPTGLAAHLVAEPGPAVNLSWDANGSDPDLAGYIVYRSDRPEGGFTPITGEPVLTNGFVDQAAPPGKQAFYRVSARDAARNESALSEFASAGPLPPAPSGPVTVGTRNAGI
jgi:hypothetical protein